MKLSDYKSGKGVKILFMGDHSTGKSGALASLAHVGYNLRICDFDAGVEILSNILNSPASPYDLASAERVDVEIFTDKMKNVNGKLVAGAPVAWKNFVKILDGWKPPLASADFGPILSWSEKDVLVVDSLTMLSRAAMRHIGQMNGRIGGPYHQGDWYAAQQLVESFLETIYDDNVICNVIVIAHIAWKGEEGEEERGFPIGPGSALNPKIGGYFNSAIMLRTQGVKRLIHTRSIDRVELKNSNPFIVKPTYDIAFGLAEYVRDIGGQWPIANARIPQAQSPVATPKGVLGVNMAPKPLTSEENKNG